MRLNLITRAALAALLILALGALAAAESPSDYDMSAPQNLRPGHLYAESALLIDEDSGEVLLNKNSRIRMYPASTTKIMTLLLGLESDIAMDDVVTIPQEAGNAPSDSSLIPVKPGDQMTWRDLLYGFMLSSGNDGANAIAVLVDGSLDAFVARMNARAAEIGCEGTRYANPSGYHDDDHYTTASDLARISQTAMQNADFRAIVASPTCDITVTRGGETRTGTIVSRNSLLQSDLKYYYPDCTGIKTGHHRRAGWCFVGSAERDGRRVICVVMNCDQEVQKWYDAARLFEYGFTCYEQAPVATLVARAAEEIGPVSVENAEDDDPRGGVLAVSVDAIEDGGATAPVVRGSEASLDAAAARIADGFAVEWTRPLVAPIEAGETLGTLTCALENGGTATATLVAARAVAAKPAATEIVATQAPAVEIEEEPESSAEPVRANRRSFALPILAALAILLALGLAIAAISRAQRQKRHRRRRRASGSRARR